MLFQIRNTPKLRSRGPSENPTSTIDLRPEGLVSHHNRRKFGGRDTPEERNEDAGHNVSKRMRQRTLIVFSLGVFLTRHRDRNPEGTRETRRRAHELMLGNQNRKGFF